MFCKIHKVNDPACTTSQVIPHINDPYAILVPV